jgi:hypothetical protein
MILEVSMDTENKWSEEMGRRSKGQRGITLAGGGGGAQPEGVAWVAVMKLQWKPRKKNIR